MNECSLNSGSCITALKCSGPRTKAHFTFKSSQEELQCGRFITALLLSGQRPRDFLPPAFCSRPSGPLTTPPLVQAPEVSAIQGAFLPHLPKFDPSIKPHCFPETFGPLQPVGVSPFGDSTGNRDHLSWSLIGTEMSLRDLHGLSNRLGPWQTSHLTSLCLTLLFCKTGEMKRLRLV